MKRSDVERSYHRGAGRRPMINVKHHFYWPDVVRQYRDGGHDFSGDPAFWEWAEQAWDDNDYSEASPFNRAEEIARECGWERAQQDAIEIWGLGRELVSEKKFFPEFPPGSQWRFTGEKVWRDKPIVRLYSEGRSGGWMVAHGLGDVDEWDLQDLNRWAKFRNYVQSTLGYLDYQLVWHLYVNVYEPFVLEPLQAEAAAGAERDADMWDGITRSLEAV